MDEIHRTRQTYTARMRQKTNRTTKIRGRKTGTETTRDDRNENTDVDANEERMTDENTDETDRPLLRPTC